MAYEINGNTYVTLKWCEAKDVWDGTKYNIDSGTEIDSIWASWIIVDTDDEELFQGLDQEQCLELKVELGYIALVP